MVRMVSGDEPVDGRVDREARTLATVTSVGGAAVASGVVASTVGGATLAGTDVAGASVVGAAVVGAAVVGATVVGVTVVGGAVVGATVVVGAVVVGAGQAGMLTVRAGHEGPARLTWDGTSASTVANPNAVNTLVRVDISLPRFGSRTWLMPAA